MFSGSEIEAGKSWNAFLIALIVEFCIIQSINQSWGGQFCLPCLSGVQCVHGVRHIWKENSRVYLAFSSLEQLKYEIRFAWRLSTGYKAENWNLDFKPCRVLDHFSQTELSSIQLLICKKAKKWPGVWIWIRALETGRCSG